MSFSVMNQKAINAIRFLSIDMIQKANSGHPGLPLGAAPMAYALWKNEMKVNPHDPEWMNRDRFVLSAGHGSSMLYAMLHLMEFDVSIDDLKQFRQLDSKTPGHPEWQETAGVDASTGPLGQGLGMAVGMAMAEKHLAKLYNRPGYEIFDHYTYALVGDGDLMEGLSHEVMGIAGDKRLDKLVVLFDSNDVTLDGALNLSTNEALKQRCQADNWDYFLVKDGNDLDALRETIMAAKQTDRPAMIEVKTVIGYGSPQQGTNRVHGSALGAANVQATREFYNWDAQPFEISDEIYDYFHKIVSSKESVYEQWQDQLEAYQQEYPDLYRKLTQNDLIVPNKIDTNLSNQATRVTNHAVMQEISANNFNFWGGSADLSSSNKTHLADSKAFTDLNPEGKNIYYGVREFGMAAIANGIALHGHTRTFVSTFFAFSDYMKAAIRLAAIQKLPVVYIYTHDSLAVGEDGPTHEPIEQLSALRAIPNVTVYRPADAQEVLGSWQSIARNTEGPSVLVLTRQDVPDLKNSQAQAVQQGAYTIAKSKTDDPDGILIGTGSEVQLVLAAQQKLLTEGYDVKVVSMPSMELFDAQSLDYQETVLPKKIVTRVSVEMGATFGWGKYTGLGGVNVGVDRFGLSGKAEQVLKYFNFTAEYIVQQFIQAFQNNNR
ncbi:transketolase [Weissella kandleri]|uniref:transketolase n=1 Tax=Weissella kandleri TaxID=1616 RepID=UPI00387E8556